MIRLNAGTAILVAGVIAAAAPAYAQQQDPTWRPFFSIAPVSEDDASLDSGGDVSVEGVLTRFGVMGDLGGGNRAGVTLAYDYVDYSFSNPVAFGGVAPWDSVQRYGVSVPMFFAWRDGWTVGVAPSVDWFRENGADWGESLTWGATVSAVKAYANGNRIGFGLGVFDRLEETNVFPVLIVDWRLAERWRLINPLAAGPTGPAGLELDYEISDNWSVGAGAAYRSSRFRLSETGPVANGVGEVRGWPVYARLGYSIRRQYTVSLVAGAIAEGELRVENSSGDLLQKEEFDLAPFVGLHFSARF